MPQNLTPTPGFRVPTHVHLHPGSRHRLHERLGERRKIALVTDPGLESTSWPDEVEATIADGDPGDSITRDCLRLDRVHANPRTSDAEALGVAVRSHACEVIVALGGGSVIDAAKGAALAATNPGALDRWVGATSFPERPLPVIAIPTTCGTGSEVTWVSVLTDESRRIKISIKGESLFPEAALVDADLIATLPTDLVAWTGMDALTHAVEATVGRASNAVSDAIAESAISLLFEHLPGAVADVTANDHDRTQTMRASTLAGLAFGNADVAGIHCLSEAIGGELDLPHGLCNAVLLAPFLRFLRPEADAALARLDRRVFPSVSRNGSPSADHFLERLQELATTVGVPGASELELPVDRLDAIADKAAANGSNDSNPRTTTAEDYRRFLDELLDR